ncbi:MAG: ribosome hibernation-promoting factor, HPF/YfiA family [Acidiferrobacterales bacterium]
MQITVTGQQVEVTEPLRNYVSEKIGRIQRHFDYMTTTNVVLHFEKRKNRHTVEATINAKGTKLHADSEHNDMYAAIDNLADKLDRQVLKHKEKMTDHHRNGGALKDQKAD